MKVCCKKLVGIFIAKLTTEANRTFLKTLANLSTLSEQH